VYIVVRQIIRVAFLSAAAVFSSAAFGDYVANQIDYIDPLTGTVANFTQLWGNNNNGNALGTASFDHGATTFSFVYDPAKGNFVRLPLPPGFDGITSDAGAVGVNDAGVITGTTFEPTGSRGFILKEGVYTFFSNPGWFTNARTIGNPTVAHPQGLVVGYLDNGSADIDSTVGFIYDPVASTFAAINTPNSFFTIAHGQNVAGQIVGNVISDGTDRTFGRWGFLFTPITGVDPMLGGTVSYFRINDMQTSARGINDKGLIAAAVRDANFVNQTYVGTPSTGFQLINVPGSTGPMCPDGFTLPGTFPEHINNAGQIAGQLTDSACNFRGFIATPASLPTGITSSGAYTFSVDVLPSAPIFISAPTALGYDYALGEHDPRFASVRLPLGMGNNKFILVVRHKAFAVNAGQLFDFRAHGFKKGVKAFRVACIDPAARLDPVNSLAFPTELTFAVAGKFTGTQQPLITATGDHDLKDVPLSQSECREQLLSRHDGDEADD